MSRQTVKLQSSNSTPTFFCMMLTENGSALAPIKLRHFTPGDAKGSSFHKGSKQTEPADLVPMFQEAARILGRLLL